MRGLFPYAEPGSTSRCVSAVRPFRRSTSRRRPDYLRIGHRFGSRNRGVLYRAAYNSSSPALTVPPAVDYYFARRYIATAGAEPADRSLRLNSDNNHPQGEK
jgi:hypothetical protein